MDEDQRIKNAISSGYTLKMYAPMKGKWIFRAVLEDDNDPSRPPIVGGAGMSIDTTLSALAKELQKMES